MTAIKVGSKYFQGGAHVYSGDQRSLSAAIRGLAIDHARIKLENANVPDLTDSSGGTAGASVVNMIVPTAAFDATSAGGAQRAAFNTALGKIENAGRVLVNSLNNARARLGLVVMSAASGTQAAADTIPAQDTSVATSNGTSALDFATGAAAMQKAKENIYRLFRGVNEVLVAAGEAPVTSALSGDMPADFALVALGTPAASATGESSVAKTVADAFLAASANNLATLAAAWNNKMFQTGLSDLTDSSGGTASATNTLVANAAPAAANGAATTSSPKAGFDTAIGIIEANLSEVATQANKLLKRYGVTPITDSTGASVDGTLAAQSATLTAVDGSSGTSAVDQVTARARMGTINNGISSLAAKLNVLAPQFGVRPITDSLEGTVSDTLADIGATGTGVGGSTGTPTLLDADVDTWLSNTRDNISTLAAVLNAMTGTEAPTKGLSVVAAV